MTMLALAVVSAAMFALPAVASAGEWVADNATGKTFSVTKVTNPVLRASNGDVVTCTGLTGEGSYTSTTTGNITLDFTGCTEDKFGTKCTTNGAGTAGTISVTNKVFHNVIIGSAADSNTPIGVLITSGGTFATFTCGGGLLEITVTGNVIGEVESPNCGVAGTTYNLNFEPVSAGSSTQKYLQVTTAGTAFDLVSDIAGTGFTSSQQGTGQIHLSGAVTPTCT
ncbi:MAG TPA: hypothetical protein VFN92_02180 [Solirubrobacterales bacterium]|nr:hypothetical protein [Solirubrobacterales bacterium]